MILMWANPLQGPLEVPTPSNGLSNMVEKREGMVPEFGWSDGGEEGGNGT